MRKCSECGKEISEYCVRCPNCWAVQHFHEYSSAEQAQILQQDMQNTKKHKKSQVKSIIAVIVTVLVAAFMLLFYVYELPQRYFGGVFSQSDEKIEFTIYSNKKIFDFDKIKLEKLHIDALDLLLLDKPQHEFSVSSVDIVDEEWFVGDIETIYYQYNKEFPYISATGEAIDGRVDWWLNIFEKNSTGQVAKFEWCMRIEENERSAIEAVMVDNIRLSLSTLNPELGIIKIDSLADELMNSEKYTEEGYKTLYYNEVCYKIAENPYKDLYALVVTPMFEEEYLELTEGFAPPQELSDEEYYDMIITLLNEKSFVEDYLYPGLYQDVSYGELIAMMFDYPEVSVERTGFNSCKVKVSGKYRATLDGPAVYYTTLTINFSDVEEGKCTINDSQFISCAKGIALDFS